MRLPNEPNAPRKTHFLTDYYAANKFHLPLKPFNNKDENAFLKFYNMEPMTIKGMELLYISLQKVDCCFDHFNVSSVA